MGGMDSKIEKPKANAVNDIIVSVEFPTVYFIIIICLIAMSLGKSYIRAASIANLDKV